MALISTSRGAAKTVWLRALGLAMLCLLLIACSKPAAEEQIRQQLAELESAVQARDASRIDSVLGENFAGPDGMDRRAARRLAAAIFLRHQAINTRTGPLQIELQGDDSARVSTTVMVSGGSGGLLPEQAEMYRFDSGWRQQGGEWRMVNASWQPLAGAR